jgi:hypothetical protein
VEGRGFLTDSADPVLPSREDLEVSESLRGLFICELSEVAGREVRWVG